MRAQGSTTILLIFAATVAGTGCDGRRETSVGAEAPAADSRTTVELPADGQQAVLQEMRTMLSALGDVMAGAARLDTTAVLTALRRVGSTAAADPALEALLPPEWKDLAERTHGGFDSLAVIITRLSRRAAIRDTVLVRLADITASCTACHAAFRLAVK